MYTPEERKRVDELLAKGNLDREESRLLMDTMRTAQERERARALSRAREEAARSGKEVFSLEELDKHYLPEYVNLDTETTEARAKRAKAFEWMYYCMMSQRVQTLKEFGEKMWEFDMYGGGDTMSER